MKKDVLNLLSKKYTYEIMKTLETGPKRFKDISDVCRNEKMRTQRLRELETHSLVSIKVQRVGRRAVSFYRLSDAGNKTLKLAEDIAHLQEKKD